MASRNLLGTSLRYSEAAEGRFSFSINGLRKEAIATVMHEGLIGLVLTRIMILLFLGNLRATTAVLLSIPLSVLATLSC